MSSSILTLGYNHYLINKSLQRTKNIQDLISLKTQKSPGRKQTKIKHFRDHGLDTEKIQSRDHGLDTEKIQSRYHGLDTEKIQSRDHGLDTKKIQYRDHGLDTSRFRGFLFTITLRQKPKGVMRMLSLCLVIQRILPQGQCERKTPKS